MTAPEGLAATAETVDAPQTARDWGLTRVAGSGIQQTVRLAMGTRLFMQLPGMLLAAFAAATGACAIPASSISASGAAQPSRPLHFCVSGMSSIAGA